MESNRQLASQIETLTNITTHQVHISVAQSVGINSNHPQYDKGGYKKQDSNEKVKESKPYLGKTQDLIPTKGKDRSLNITDTCNYCKIWDTSLVTVKSKTIESKKVWLDQSIQHKRFRENR